MLHRRLPAWRGSFTRYVLPYLPPSRSSFLRYKTSETRIIVAVDPSRPGADEIDLPERVRIVKLANSVTYDRFAL
jgi:hypothetical protein